MKKLFLLFFCFSVWIVSGFAQAPDLKWEENHVFPKKWKKGASLTLSFTATIPAGYHVYAAAQPSDAALPTTIKLDDKSRGGKLNGKISESGKRVEEMDAIFQKKVAYYSDKVTFYQKVKLSSETPRLSGDVSFQVCNEEMCIPGKYHFEVNKK